MIRLINLLAAAALGAGLAFLAPDDQRLDLEGHGRGPLPLREIVEIRDSRPKRIQIVPEFVVKRGVGIGYRIPLPQ